MRSTEVNASYIFTAFECKFHFYKIEFQASAYRTSKGMQNDKHGRDVEVVIMQYVKRQVCVCVLP